MKEWIEKCHGKGTYWRWELGIMLTVLTIASVFILQLGPKFSWVESIAVTALMYGLCAVVALAYKAGQAATRCLIRTWKKAKVRAFMNYLRRNKDWWNDFLAEALREVEDLQQLQIGFLVDCKIAYLPVDSFTNYYLPSTTIFSPPCVLLLRDRRTGKAYLAASAWKIERDFYSNHLIRDLRGESLRIRDLRDAHCDNDKQILEFTSTYRTVAEARAAFALQEVGRVLLSTKSAFNSPVLEELRTNATDPLWMSGTVSASLTQ